MNQLATNGIPLPDRNNLESILASLAKYGRPRLGLYDGGWYCTVDMFVTGDGVEFKIASEFKNPTPLQAAFVCWERLQHTLDGLRISS